MTISRRSVLAALPALVGSLSVTPVQAQVTGRFHGNPVLRLLDDGRTAELMEPFAYTAPDGTLWQVPARARVDGASIPRVLWSITGGPFEGRYRNASIIHDWFCDVRTRSWQDTHRVFHAGMLTAGVSRRPAGILYAAVRRFGPRWNSTAIHNLTLSDSESSRLAAAAPIRLNPALAEAQMMTAALQARDVFQRREWEAAAAAYGADGSVSLTAAEFAALSAEAVQQGRTDEIFSTFVADGVPTEIGIVGASPDGGLTVQITQTPPARDEDVEAFLSSIPDEDLEVEELDRLADAQL